MKLPAELTSDAVLYALAASLAFLAAVLVVDPKLRRSAIGQSLIVLDVGLAALYIPSVIQRFTGVHLLTSAWFAWYVLGTVLVIGTATWWRTAIMVRAQWRGRRGPDR